VIEIKSNQQLTLQGDKPMSMGGNLGGGGFFGGGAPMGPSGPYGAYPGCGCSSFFIIIAGFLLVFGGCLRMLGQ
jgi:hypothetical protein